MQTDNSGDLDSDFIWEDFRDRSNAKQAGVIIGLIFGLIWPYIAWILLKLAGYAVIAMTFGHGHEFVSSTFFRWTDKMGNGFYKMILEQGGVCWCQLFYIASMALGKDAYRNGQNTRFWQFSLRGRDTFNPNNVAQTYSVFIKLFALSMP